MSKYLVLDFETKDPYIALGMGAGWVYSLHNPNSLFKVIGYSLATILDNDIIQVSYDNMDRGIPENFYINYDGIIMHNAQYDLGCLLSLGISIGNLKVYDTKIMAQLYDNTLNSYSLDYLSKKYLAKEHQKDMNSLIGVVKRNKLLKSPSGKPINENTKTYDERALKWAYQNMDVIQELDFETMAYYAKQDVIATANLFLHFLGGEN